MRAGLAGAACLLSAGCVLPALQLEDAPLDSERCIACASLACDEAYRTCTEQDDCAQLLDCALDCPPGDADCISSCAGQFPNGVADALTLLDCTEHACAEECEGLGLS